MARFTPCALAIVVALYTATTVPAIRSSQLAVDVGAEPRRSAADDDAKKGAAEAGKAKTGAAADVGKAGKGAGDVGKPKTAAAADMGTAKTGAANTKKSNSGVAAVAGKVKKGATEDVGKAKKGITAPVGNAKKGAVATVGKGKTGATSAPLIAAATSLPRNLARVLGGRVKEEGSAQISVVGPASSYAALKAVFIANQYMRKEFPGKVLAAVPTKVEATLKDGSKTVGYTLEVRAMPALAGVKKPVALLDGDADASFLPGFMFRRLKKQDMLSVGAMGSKAVYRVMRATVIAQGMLEKEQGAGESELALVPSFAKFQRRGKMMSRMGLACVRASD